MIMKISTGMGRWDNLLFRLVRRIKKNDHASSFDFRNIPVIINNFNRLQCLGQQIQWLEKAGIKNIFIIDNFSGYKPLQEFYRRIKHTVFLLNKNVGFDALWKTVIFQHFKSSYYVYTDPDIIPVEECPLNAVKYFYELLQKYPHMDKAGFGLVTNDLPNHYPLKEKVIAWESQFTQKQMEENIFDASIDTTFALYRPGVKGGSELKALRTGYPYVARHTAWYINPEALDEEEKFYMLHAGTSASWISEMTGRNRNIQY